MPVLEIKKKKESLTEIKNITAVSEFLEHGKVSSVPVGRRLGLTKYMDLFAPDQ